MIRASFDWFVAAIKTVVAAPVKVPMAWAKKGKTKCLGSNKCKVALSPSMVVTSAPLGGGIIELLIKMIAILMTLPTKRPIRTAKVFLKIGFIVVVLVLRIYGNYSEDNFFSASVCGFPEAFGAPLPVVMSLNKLF